MKRLIIIMTLLALVMTGALAAQSTLGRVYKDLEVDIWTDQDDGSNYTEGDELTIYFRASRDCYVVIYDLDTRGNINLMFPSDPDDPHFIEGDEIYMIPGHDADYALIVEGPPGDEHIQMVASVDYFPVPEWHKPVSVYDENLWGFEYEDDNDLFVSMVNERVFPVSHAVYDYVSFYVAPERYYRAAKTSCYDNCGEVYIDYPVGCDVYIDGVFWGYAPLYIPSVYYGRHRVSVYWGATIVYHDWINVGFYEPVFVYTRPHYIYDYCYTNWYFDRYWDYNWYGGYHFSGPSQYKYKQRHYDHRNLKTYKGYKIVSNTHFKYKKAKVYTVDKKNRISKYKTKYGFNKKTKAYVAAKKAKSKTTAFGTKKGSGKSSSYGSSAKGVKDTPGWKASGYSKESKSKIKSKKSGIKSGSKSTVKSSSKSAKSKSTVKSGSKGSTSKNKSTVKSGKGSKSSTKKSSTYKKKSGSNKSGSTKKSSSYKKSSKVKKSSSNKKSTVSKKSSSSSKKSSGTVTKSSGGKSSSGSVSGKGSSAPKSSGSRGGKSSGSKKKGR